jgi:hypothetical protein
MPARAAQNKERDSMNPKRIAFFGPALLAVAAAAAGLLLTAKRSAASDADDDKGFSNASVQGQWGFGTSLGEVVSGPPQPLPTAAVGRIFFDGAGGCKVQSILNTNGVTTRLASSQCTYHVDPDGFGTSEATFPGAPFSDPIPVAFVIVDHGREIDFVVEKFIVGTFVAKRQ